MATAAHATWKGHLRLSLVSCPVQLHVAVSDRDRIRLNMLNRATGNRVRQTLRDQETGAEVERGETIRGYEYEKGRYVVLDDDDLEKAESAVQSAHTIDLTRFVDSSEVDELYFEKPYWVTPDGPVATETYRVICEAMKTKGKAAIGSVTMATRERPVLVKPRGLGLVAFTLRSPDEVRSEANYFAGLERQEVNAEMVALGAMIIEQKSGAFDPSLFEDAYQKSLRQIIEAKIGGTAPKLKPAAAQSGNVVDLMAALKRSLETGRSATPPAPTKKRAAAAPPPAAKAKKTARRKTG